MNVQEKRAFADASARFNIANHVFRRQFPHMADAAEEGEDGGGGGAAGAASP